MYAGWKINEHTVSFETNGGILLTEIKKDYGTTIVNTPLTRKVGYTFGGWFTDNNFTTAVSFPYVVTGDTTLYAKWNDKQYKITFKNSDDSDVGIDPQLITYNTMIARPADPTRADYIFSGWYSDRDCTRLWDFNTGIGAVNVTLYAGWTRAVTEINFESNSYTVEIPNTGDATRLLKAEAKDSLGNVVSNAVISYSIPNAPGGVSIDSTTGLLTVTPQAQIGSVQVNATCGNLTCSATVVLSKFSDTMDLTIESNKIYNIEISVSDIISFSGKTITVTYDKDKLLVKDLCAYTYNKELGANLPLTIPQTDITITGFTEGEITFTVNRDIAAGKKWSGVINIIQFEARVSGTTSIIVH
jgi:uncharacterized repeat protein (TIGR02543 family)